MKCQFALRMAIMLALSLVAGGLWAQERPPGPPPPQIAAQGMAEVRVAPDRAIARFGVQAQTESARTAQQRVNEAMQKVIQALRGLKIPENRISTERLELFPVYSSQRPQDREGAPRLVGYRAANVVRVELDSTERVGPVIDAAIGAGANTIEGIQFTLANDAPHRQRALQQAALEGRDKAQAIAAALDARLGRLLEASEGGVDFIPPRPLEFARAGVGGADTPVQPGEIVVRATVSVRYAIAGG